MKRKTKRCVFGMTRGRSNYLIYAVVLKDHPNIVKLGRTSNWNSRRNEYLNWNLCDGDGILDFAVYCLTEEWVNLPQLESACLSAMPTRPYRGREWFRASLEDAKLAIEDTLNTAQISYTDFYWTI
jgi:hypothetical protein